jgi:hypothetical protein
MSRVFKRTLSIDPRERKAEKEVREMAREITGQAMLDKLLEGSTHEMRAAMLARIGPYLCFVPDVPMELDCPQCGRKGGAVIAHECVLPVDSAS